MKPKHMFCSALVAVFIGTSMVNGVAAEKKADTTKLEAKAKVSKAAAKKTALSKVPNGKVTDSELEEENGKMVWSFDISTPGSKDITEVQVDAVTGEVVSVAKETPADQAKEKQEKAKEKAEKK